MNFPIVSTIVQLIVFGLLAIFLLRFAHKSNYFNAFSATAWKPSIEWYHVLGVFGIYFGISYFFTPILFGMFKKVLAQKTPEESQIAVMTWGNYINSLLIFFCILITSFRQFKTIWIKEGEESHYLQDVKVMLVSLILAFPVMLFLSNLTELIVHGIFHIENLPDQIAVQWLKLTFEYPKYFAVTAFMIIVIAPVLEETLFRGYLQSFLRNYLGPKLAIVITAFCFSFFHFAWGQGWNNIPIITTLFPLALFLGFIYEKQASLFASISMHATFNALSLVNIYFFGQFL